jgi:transposase InsO family protein
MQPKYQLDPITKDELQGLSNIELCDRMEKTLINILYESYPDSIIENFPRESIRDFFHTKTLQRLPLGLGSTYTPGLYGYQGSMSRKGNCWDNAVAESFFGSLKQERVQWKHYQTRYEAQQDILNYIAMFYNNRRLHSSLNYLAPNQYEVQRSQLKKVA